MKRTVLMLLLGALPIAALAIVSHYLPRAGDDASVRLGVCTGLGALWGLAAGVFRRSLFRAILGLNAGALCGYVYNATALSPAVLSDRDVIAGLIASGAALGGILSFQRGTLGPAFKGMLAGVLAFGFMGCAAWVVAQVLEPNLLGWPVMCLVPFGGGIAIFTALVGREPQAGSVATARADGTVHNYDYERGRDATVPQPNHSTTVTDAT